MVFPKLAQKSFGYANLNLEAARWLSENGISKAAKNPLLNPATCEKMVESVHARLGVDFSYGGWMEDRSTLWHGSYLDGQGGYVHLGIDINVPPGTEVAADFDATVARIDDDYPEEGGWGPRVILKHASLPVYIIYAHLDRALRCKKGDAISKGQIFAAVGRPPYNGNWFPHLHVQRMTAATYEELEQSGSWKDLDGYGAPEDTAENARKFPDRLQFISLHD